MAAVDDPLSRPAVVEAVPAAPALVTHVDVDGARHFPSFEQPEAYAAAVGDCVVEQAGP